MIAQPAHWSCWHVSTRAMSIGARLAIAVPVQVGLSMRLRSLRLLQDARALRVRAPGHLRGQQALLLTFRQAFGIIVGRRGSPDAGRGVAAIRVLATPGRLIAPASRHDGRGCESVGIDQRSSRQADRDGRVMRVVLALPGAVVPGVASR